MLAALLVNPTVESYKGLVISTAPNPTGPKWRGVGGLLIHPRNAETLKRAAQIVADGGIIAFRTDTFYGLGADPFRRDALRALNLLKGREDKPILVVISEHKVAESFIENKSRLFKALADAHWPGPLTIVAEARREVPEELTAGTGTVGVRLPVDAQVRALVKECGGALTATSANPAGAPPAGTAEEVALYFQTGLGLIIDDGAAITDRPSTVVEVKDNQARLIREGLITKEELLPTLEAVGAVLV